MNFLGWGFGTFGLWFFLVLWLLWAFKNKVLQYSTKIPIAGPILGWLAKLFVGKPAAMTKEGITRTWIGLLYQLKRNKYSAYVVGEWLQWRDPTLPNELPIVYKRLRLEIFTLFNWMLRHEVWTAKGNTAKMLYEEIREREGVLAERVPTFEDIFEDMKSKIEGSEIFQNNEGLWELRNPNRGVGFARQYYRIHQIMMEFKKMLETADLTKIKEPPEIGSKERTDAIESFVKNMRDKYMNSWIKDLDYEEDGVKKGIYNRYLTAVKRYKVVNMIRAYRLLFLDMYNMMGVYERGYGFAKVDAKPDYYTWQPKAGNDGDNGVTRAIDWDNVKRSHSETGNVTNYEKYDSGNDTEFLVEVNLYGFSTSDINAIQIGRQNLQYIKRYKKKDIVYLHKTPDKKPTFAKVLELAHHDWDFAIDDMEKCSFHPYSKRVTDYTTISYIGQKGVPYHMDFSKATFKAKLTYGETGFDREALKNPGKLVYWGRKHYYDETRDSLGLEPVNPYPGISLYGLWGFISHVARNNIKESEIAERFLANYFSMGYGPIMERKSEKK